jgi:hypothetical protein
MAEPGQHTDADSREDTERERLEAAREADLPSASPVSEGEEAAHPPGHHAPSGTPPERPGHRGPQVRREPGKPGKPGER